MNNSNWKKGRNVIPNRILPPRIYPEFINPEFIISFYFIVLIAEAEGTEIWIHIYTLPVNIWWLTIPSIIEELQVPSNLNQANGKELHLQLHKEQAQLTNYHNRLAQSFILLVKFDIGWIWIITGQILERKRSEWRKSLITLLGMCASNPNDLLGCYKTSRFSLSLLFFFR